jgi:SAM-dependent methyltransferase
MTFPSSSFDLFITQDVFEHVMCPDAAFAEIGRVLKPSGAHVFTLPWYKDKNKSTKRACMEKGEIVNLEPPIYHGNPIDKTGALVTYDFGMDLFDYIVKSSGLNTIVYLHEDRNLGLDAEYLEVFISYKSVS